MDSTKTARAEPPGGIEGFGFFVSGSLLVQNDRAGPRLSAFRENRQMHRQKSQHAQKYAVSFGCIALGLGAVIYLLIRDPHSLYVNAFVPLPDRPLWIIDFLPSGKAILFGSAPTALHTFSFSIFTAIALGITKAKIVISCSVWALINVLFESMQSFQSYADHFGFPIAMVEDLLCAYVEGGVFDWFDVVSILIGAGCAFVVLMQLQMATEGAKNDLC